MHPNGTRPLLTWARDPLMVGLQVIATLRRGEDYVEAFEYVTVLFSGEARRAKGRGSCAFCASALRAQHAAHSYLDSMSRFGVLPYRYCVVHDHGVRDGPAAGGRVGIEGAGRPARSKSI